MVKRRTTNVFKVEASRLTCTRDAPFQRKQTVTRLKLSNYTLLWLFAHPLNFITLFLRLVSLSRVRWYAVNNELTAHLVIHNVKSATPNSSVFFFAWMLKKVIYVLCPDFIPLFSVVYFYVDTKDFIIRDKILFESIFMLKISLSNIIIQF